MPKKFFIPQPGEDGPTDFYKDSDIEPFMTLWAFNRPFQILVCDEFTADYYLKNYKRNFPLGGFEDPPQKEKGRIIINLFILFLINIYLYILLFKTI